MHHRNFSFDKIKNKVTGRRSSESSILEIASSEIARRNSVSNPMIVISEEKQDTSVVPSRNRLRAQSLSLLHGNNNTASRSRSRSVKKMQTKALIKQETASVISKKLLHVLLDLGIQNPISLDTTSGGSRGPSSKTSKMYVANTSDCIYLDPATSASFTYEDIENGNLARNDYDVNDDDTSQDDVFNEDDPLSNHENSAGQRRRSVPTPLRQKINKFKSPNYLCSEIDSEGPKPHTFAVIVELNKEMVIKELKVEFHSVVNMLWPSGDPYNKSYTREKYDIGLMEWSTSLNDCDYYISTENTNDIKSKNLSTVDLAKRTREYTLLQIQDLSGNPTKGNTSGSRKGSIVTDNESSSSSSTEITSESCKAGLYVFLLPILIPGNIPGTVNSINGSLNHILNIDLFKISDKLNRKVKTHATYNLPMVRTPPSVANSIADKPIYVNRVWNDSLHYIITFPKKYVALGNEHLINLKLVPLVKDVIIKRIKFNVLERITYVSKNLTREYEYDSDDPYLLRSYASENKVRERVVPVYELTTKSKGGYNHGEPYKEEVISCPDNNLLFSCYESEMDNLALNSNCDPLSKPDRNSMIATPLDINICLPLLTTKIDKTLLSSSVGDDHNDISSKSDPTSRNSITSMNSPNIEGSPKIAPAEGIPVPNEINLWDEENIFIPDHSTLLSEPSHNSMKDPIQQGYTVVGKALYPDSNFRNIQICHRLQVCFRISKKDPKDGNKMHHYEVVVDTPLILLSSKCYDASIQLPKYNELSGDSYSGAEGTDSISFRTPVYNGNGVSIKPLSDSEEQLPSFEEATSPMSSPVTRSISIDDNNISRFPSVSIPTIPDEPAPAYEFTEDIPSTGRQNQLNIDEIVTSKKRTSDSNMLSPTIRQSLSNSFATTLPNSLSNDEIQDGSSDTPNNTTKDVEYSIIIPDNATNPSINTDDSSKNDSESSISLTALSSEPPDSSTSKEADSLGLNNESIDSYQETCSASLMEGNSDDVSSNDIFSAPLNDTDSACDEVKYASAVVEKDNNNTAVDNNLVSHEKDGTKSSNDLQKENNEQGSIYSQETSNFAQRLPLLENCSIDCITTQSISNVGRSKDDISVITDGFVHQAQDYYRAC